MSRVFNQRFRQRTLRSEIKQYDKIKGDADILSVKLKKFIHRSKNDQLKKIRVMQEEIKKQQFKSDLISNSVTEGSRDTQKTHKISPKATIQFIENHQSLEIPEKDKVF